MNNEWQQIGLISPGGTVFSLVHDHEQRLWLASSAGIFYHAGETWPALAGGQPLAQVHALAWAGQTLLAGGSAGQIVYSTDGGQSWYQAQTGSLSQAITWLQTSPQFHLDRMIWAGTEGAGVIRSRDGGRTWQQSSAGLEDLAVIALATPPLESWERRALVLAATARGLYRSTNGGRSWTKAAGELGELAVQAMAFSPNFARDSLALAATETAGLFRTVDRGQSWQPWGTGLGSSADLPPLNCLWLHPDFASRPICLAGAGDGQIFRSEDGGASWTRVFSGAGSIFCLASEGQRLYAGLHDQGLLWSEDEGQTWTVEPALAARAFTRLSGGYGRRLFAFGPWEGVWHSQDGGETWQRAPGLADYAPLVVAASPQAERPCLFVGSTTGLLRSEDEGQSWQTVLPVPDVVAVVFSPRFAEDGQVWAGASAGDLLGSSDGGLTWTPLSSPRAGQALVALAASPVSPDALAAATFNQGRQQLVLWRSEDGGRRWKQWMQVSAAWPAAQLSLADQRTGGAMACVGQRCWQVSAAGWQRTLDTDKPVIRLQRLPGPAGALLLTADQLLRSAEGQTWIDLGEGLGGRPWLDLALLSSAGDESSVYVLGTGGVIWRRAI